MFFKSFMLAGLLAVTAVPVLKATGRPQDSTAISREYRKLKGFHGISATGALDIELTQGPAELVTVSAAEEKMLPYIITEVRDGVLRISIEKNDAFNWSNSGNFNGGTPGGRPNKITVKVSVRALESIEATNSCCVYLHNAITCKRLNLDMSGSSALKGKIITGALTGHVLASANVVLSGSCQELNLTVAGSARLEAADFSVQQAKVDLQGSSITIINVVRDLTAHLSGNSSLTYKGASKQAQIFKEGNSQVVHLDQ